MLAAILTMMLSMPPIRYYPANFVDCYDGDTCTFDLTLDQRNNVIGLGITEQVSIVKHHQHIRLCDINAPELHPAPNTTAIKAKTDLINWIKAAKNIQLVIAQKPNCALTDPGCDEYEKYGRLLGYIIADGVNLNQKQVEVGNAQPFIMCK